MLFRSDLVPWLCDSLHATPEEAAPLATLLHARTGGNPFFTMQFLQLLESAGLVAYDAAAGRWGWQVERIAQAPLPADVVELMIGRIQTLPPKTQYALTLAACIGNRFDAATLALVSEQDLDRAHDDLPRRGDGRDDHRQRGDPAGLEPCLRAADGRHRCRPRAGWQRGLPATARRHHAAALKGRHPSRAGAPATGCA